MISSVKILHLCGVSKFMSIFPMQNKDCLSRFVTKIIDVIDKLKIVIFTGKIKNISQIKWIQINIIIKSLN